MKQYNIRFKRNGKWMRPMGVTFKSFSYESVQHALSRAKEHYKENEIEVDEWKIVCREVSEWQDL